MSYRTGSCPACRETPEEKARGVLVRAIRSRFPEDASLSDGDLLAKHVSEKQLTDLVGYFERLQKSHDDLDRRLLNAG